MSVDDKEFDNDVADFDSLCLHSTVKQDYQSSFLEKYCNQDVEEAIRMERELTYQNLHRLGDTVTMDDRFYKEVLLRAKREYTGQHMKAIYTD